MSEALATLIAKLEGATAASRDLDEDIALATGLWRRWISKHRYWNFNGPDGKHFHYPDDGLPRFDPETGDAIDLEKITPVGWGDEAGLPEWTASVDAALSLAPDGWNSRLGLMKTAKDKWVASVSDGDAGGVGNAPSPALALCIAALRAQQARGRQGSAINAAIGQENPVSVLCINMGDFDAQIWEPCDIEKARVAVPARAEEPEPMPPPRRRRQATKA